MKQAYEESGDTSHTPWWKFGLVWMVWAGPAVVVVASFITLGLAIMVPDPVILQAPTSTSQTAAHQARNHAATGNQVKPGSSTKP